MISIKSFVFNPFAENTYVVFDETNKCLIIDPGCYEPNEKQELASYISSNKLQPVKLINTHGHIDHILGNDFVKSEYNIQVYIHEIEIPTYESVNTYASDYGFADYVQAEIDHYLSEGEKVSFGDSFFEVLFVPGHSPGHVALINESQNICIGGDVLFKGSIGRTDLPGGNFDILIDSIQKKIFPLGDDMIVYNGHGPETTVGEEKMYNPFCAVN